VTEEAEQRARERDEARAERDWAKADAIRDALVADGWIVEDAPDGTRLRRNENVSVDTIRGTTGI
jgi:cysteinyl-tRNA synthetase